MHQDSSGQRRKKDSPKIPKMQCVNILQSNYPSTLPTNLSTSKTISNCPMPTKHKHPIYYSVYKLDFPKASKFIFFKAIWHQDNC